MKKIEQINTPEISLDELSSWCKNQKIHPEGLITKNGKYSLTGEYIKKLKTIAQSLNPTNISVNIWTKSMDFTLPKTVSKFEFLDYNSQVFIENLYDSIVNDSEDTMQKIDFKEIMKLNKKLKDLIQNISHIDDNTNPELAIFTLKISKVIEYTNSIIKQMISSTSKPSFSPPTGYNHDSNSNNFEQKVLPVGVPLTIAIAFILFGVSIPQDQLVNRYENKSKQIQPLTLQVESAAAKTDNINPKTDKAEKNKVKYLGISDIIIDTRNKYRTDNK